MAHERREKKLKAKRKRMHKHGKNIGTVYKNALEKTNRLKLVKQEK